MSRDAPRGRRDQTDYYKRWYESNAEQRNATRRDRYATDPKYAERIRAKSRERKRRILSERKGRVERIWNGKSVLVYPISWVSREAGVSSERIRSLEKSGVIPECAFGGNRIYTEHQANLIIKLVEALRAGVPASKAKDIVHATWMSGL